MDKYFKLPTGYACLQRNGDGVYAYSQDYRTRDTFELDNFEYLKVSSSTSNVGYNVNTCLPNSLTHLIPSSISGFVFLSIVISIIALSAGLFSIFRR